MPLAAEKLSLRPPTRALPAERLVVEGPVRLQGAVKVSGAKNSSLPILAASLLAEGRCVIREAPRLRDVETMLLILRMLGMEVRRLEDGSIETRRAGELGTCPVPSLVRSLRASISLLGPLLALKGEARVALPGGCVIGPRPIDLHLKGLSALGAEFRMEKGALIGRARRLKGAKIYLGGPSGATVLGTANVMTAATVAHGTTVIEHAACEPEIADLARFLRSMGAEIEGAGTHKIIVRGVGWLAGADHTVIPDRIEAGTLLIAAAATRGSVAVKGADGEALSAVLDALQACGAKTEEGPGWVSASLDKRPRAMELSCLPYPGFPTDLQAQMVVLLSGAEGESRLKDAVFPERFAHVVELNKMGATVERIGDQASIRGGANLRGRRVRATDLRASAALVLAGLAAGGRTIIEGASHIDRGYERLDEKLQTLGARLWRKR